MRKIMTLSVSFRALALIPIVSVNTHGKKFINLPTPEIYRRQEVTDKILTYIHNHPACAQREIAHALGVSPYDAVFIADMVKLEDSGLASCFVQIDPKTGENFYRWGLTNKGECAIIKM
jgi:hypothetical protein